MNRAEAIKKLKSTGELSTGMLEPLGLSFELFLAYAQAPAAKRARAVAHFLEGIEGAGE